MNMVLRMSSLAIVLSFFAGTGFSADKQPPATRFRAVSLCGEGEVSRPQQIIGRQHSGSFGSGRSPQSPMHVFRCRGFDRASLQDPRKFIKAIEVLFEENTEYLDAFALNQIPLQLFKTFMRDSRCNCVGVEETLADTSEKSGDDVVAPVLMVWQYCVEKGIFAAIKKGIAALADACDEVMSFDLLGTSVASGSRIIEDRDSVVARNACVVKFIEEQEAQVQEVLDSQKFVAAKDVED